MNEKLRRLSGAAYIRSSLISQSGDESGEKLLAKLSNVKKDGFFGIENFYVSPIEEKKIATILYILKSREWFPKVNEKLVELGLKNYQNLARPRQKINRKKKKFSKSLSKNWNKEKWW